MEGDAFCHHLRRSEAFYRSVARCLLIRLVSFYAPPFVAFFSPVLIPQFFLLPPELPGGRDISSPVGAGVQ